MNIQISSTNILKHLSEFHNITDEEIEKRATSLKGGLDAEEALMLYLERDFCRSVSFSIIKKLSEI
jgi:hypothetical protein